MLRYFLIFFLMLFQVTVWAQQINVRTYIPKNVYLYKDMVLSEQKELWPGAKEPAYMFALIEQESCIGLKHSKCWNPASKLKTSREEGAGLGQLTRAYREDGSLRFDSLKGIRDQYKLELEELSWSNIYQRPDLQIRAMTLMVRDIYYGLSDIKDPMKRYHFADAAYNGGTRDLRKERIACGLTPNCDPMVWFDNVEDMRVKSQKPIYGNRSAYDINREHVDSVFKIRLPKYQRLLATP